MSGAWASARRSASFRGVAFVVLENSLRRGRQVALHAYPFRDDPWPEDLGRSPRVTGFRGFVVGDDADQRIADLIDAVEQPGPGELVHPTLGALTVQVLTFSASDAPDRGRVWSFEMSVVPATPRVYPAASADTQGQVKGWFGKLKDTVAKDFAAVQSTVKEVRSTVNGYVQTAEGYIQQGQGLIHDATSLAHLPKQLVGNFGRFNLKSLTNGSGLSSVSQATGLVSGATSSVDRIGATLGSLASKL